MLENLTFSFQINGNSTKSMQSLNGWATIKFAKHDPFGSVHGKMNQGLKTDKCFVLYDNNISEIRGHLVDNKLKVKFQNTKKY